MKIKGLRLMAAMLALVMIVGTVFVSRNVKAEDAVILEEITTEDVTTNDSEETSETEAAQEVILDEETVLETETETETETEVIEEMATEPETEITRTEEEQPVEKSGELALLERVKGLSEDETYETLLEYSVDEVLDAYVFLSGGIDPDDGPLYVNFEAAKDRFLAANAPRKMMLMAKTSTGGTASVTAYSKLTAANDPSGSKLNVGAFTVSTGGSSLQALCLHHALTYPPTGTSLTVLETTEVTLKDKGSWEYDYARLIYHMYINKTSANTILSYMYNNHKYSPDPLRGPYQRHMNPTDSYKDDYYRIMVTLACSYLNSTEKGGSTTDSLRYTSTKDYDDFYKIGAAVWTVLNDTSVIANSDLPDGITVKLVFMYPGSTAQQPLMAWDSYDTPAANVSVSKTSSNPTVTNNNSSFKFTGITYGLYTTSACTTLAKTKSNTDAIFTLKADGTSNVLSMKDGTYYLKERSVPAGCNYQLSTTVTTVTLEPGETKFVSTTDAPATAQCTLTKTSANTAITDSNSSYSFTNITYGLYTTSACTTLAKTTSNANATFTVKANGVSNTLTMWPGTYYLKEISVPATCGYSLSTAVQTVTLAGGDNKSISATDTPLYDTVGITIQKVSKDGGTYNLSNAEYTVKYYAGQYTKSSLPATPSATWVIKTTNSGNRYLAALDDNHIVSGSGAKYGKESNGTYRLPLGTITIEETKAPAGFQLEGATMQLSSGNGSDMTENVILLNLTEQNSKVVLKSGNQVDTDSTDGFVILSTEIPNPSISTTATDALTGTHEGTMGENVEIIDVVAFENLIPGKSYTLQGSLMVKETGETLKANGTPVTATKTFVPETESGTVTISFMINTTDLAGKSLVVFEDLIRDGKTVASHADLSDEGQTINFPNRKTLVLSKKVTGNMASRDKYFKFHVTFSGMSAGEKIEISYAEADKTIPAYPNHATTVILEEVTQIEELILGKDGTASVDIYLQHGQKVTFTLRQGISYQITEDPENYAASFLITGDGDAITGETNRTGTQSLTVDTTVEFTNQRSVAVPTKGPELSRNAFAIAGICLLVSIWVAVDLIQKKKTKGKGE